MIYKIIQKLERSGELKKLTNAGLISTKLFIYLEVYMEYDKNIKMGMSKMEALHNTSIEMKVGETLIYRAKKIMQSK